MVTQINENIKSVKYISEWTFIRWKCLFTIFGCICYIKTERTLQLILCPWGHKCSNHYLILPYWPQATPLSLLNSNASLSPNLMSFFKTFKLVLDLNIWYSFLLDLCQVTMGPNTFYSFKLTLSTVRTVEAAIDRIL